MDPADVMAKYGGARRSVREDPGASALMPLREQRTMDGDTLEAKVGKVPLALPFRLAGIDAPESAEGELGTSAQAALDKMVEAAGGDLKSGVRRRDPHGRWVASLYAGGKNVSVELVRGGHARVYDRYLDQLPAPVARALLDAQEEARSAGVGVWANGGGGEDSEAFRRSQEAALGSRAAFAGHVVRERRDAGVMSPREVLAKYGKGRWQGGGGGFSGGGASGSERPAPAAAGSGGGAVPAGNRYEPEQGFLGHVLGGLDYLGNMTRSAIAGGIEGGVDKALAYGGQAAAKQRKTTSTQLKDLATEAAGLGKVRFGEDDGDFQLGDVADFAADLVVDIYTDPVTLLTAGTGRLLKGGGAIAKGAAALKAAEALEEPITGAAKKYLQMRMGAQAALGATYGYGAADKDASGAEKAFDTTVGALLGAAAGPGLAKAGKGAREWADSVSDWYAVKTRGSRFADWSNQRRIMIGAFEKKKNIAEWIRQGRLEALDGLSEVERMEATQIMRELKRETVKMRNARQRALGVKDGSAGFNEMMRGINDEVSNEVLPRVVAKQSAGVVKAVKKWGEHNERVVAKFNKMIHGDDLSEADKASQWLVGLRFHIDDVVKKKDAKEGLDQAEEALAGFLHRKATSQKMKNPTGLTADESYAVYAEQEASKFFTGVERKALEFMGEYKESALKGGVVGTYAKVAEPVLHAFDKLTNFAKANMLYFSTSWLVNNFWDNLAKSWVENGLAGLKTSKAMVGLQKATARDVFELYKGNISRAYKYEHFKDALNLGVLDNPMYKSLTDEVTRDFLFAPKELLKAAHDDKKLAGYLRRGADLWMEKNPVVKLVGNVGSFMEGQGRLGVYVNTLEGLRKSEAFVGVKDHVLKRIAAKTTRDAFFDYGAVTALEAATLKRIIPFYSFYSKNVPYWMKATFDPERAGRVVALEKVRHNIGKTPTAEEQGGMSPYIAENAPRSLGVDKRGDSRFLITPSMSMHDATKMLDARNWGGQIVEKGNPIAKAGYELATGKDLFSGGNLYPEDEAAGMKFLYSRGFKWYAVKKALEFMGHDPDGVIQKVAGTAGVDVDAKGNPYTRSGWTVVLDKIGSTFLPHGFVDQVAGSIGKGMTGKETIDEVIFNRVAAMKKVKVSEAQGRMVRMSKEKEKK